MLMQTTEATPFNKYFPRLDRDGGGYSGVNLPGSADDVTVPTVEACVVWHGRHCAGMS